MTQTATTQDALLQEIYRIAEHAKMQSPAFNVERFLEAFEFARNAHEGQVRKDGSLYITHPVEAAKILSEFFPDEETLIATLLHDVPEDTSHSLEEVEEHFGTSIAFLVDGITKLSKVHYQNNMEQRQVESLKKLLLHTAHDPRVILIKLADRLHNMRTLQYVQKPEKRLRIARETLEVYVPMANLMGIQGIKSELEDLCFQYLYSDEYVLFKKHIEKSEKRLQPLIRQTIDHLQKEFSRHSLEASIMYRKKTLYSIFRKLQSDKKNVHSIYDIMTFRIFVPTSDDCYKALGIIHALYKPKTGRFKDYIALPKVNEYRSLHTTVFGPKGVLAEFQIRTHEMHIQSEHGIVNRMIGKNYQPHNGEKERAFWMDQILASEESEKDSREFLSEVKGDIFEDRMYVFTPKGDAVYLPKDCTGIDFAYAIHTDIGNKAVKLEINGEPKILTTTLKSGDTVRVITAPDARGPELSWLTFGKTTAAKNRIREFLRKDNRRTKIERGKQILQKAFNRAGLGIVDDIELKSMQKCLQHHENVSIENLSDLFIAVAEGTLDISQVIDSMYPHQELRRIARRGVLGNIIHMLFGPKSTLEIVEIRISGKDRQGLLKDIVTVLAQFHLNIVKLKGWHQTTLSGEKGFIVLTIELDTFKFLNTICAHLEQIDGVEKVERLFFHEGIGFVLGTAFAIGFWLSHPFLLHFLVTSNLAGNRLILDVIIFIGVLLVFFVAFYLHIVTRRFFAAFRQARGMWVGAVAISLFAIATISAELYYYRFYFQDSFLIFSGLFSVLVYLGFQFFQYRRLKRS